MHYCLIWSEHKLAGQELYLNKTQPKIQLDYLNKDISDETITQEREGRGEGQVYVNWRLLIVI